MAAEISKRRKNGSTDRDVDSWHLANVFDYWDAKTQAITRLSQKVRECKGEQQRQELASAIATDVEHHAQRLSDADLMHVSVTLVDDLYKGADRTQVWDVSLALYLAASAGTCSRAVAKRGYLVHYLVDNSFAMSE